MLTLTTIHTANSRYDALTIDGRVIAVNQIFGSYIPGVTDAGYLAIAGTCNTPSVGRPFEYHTAALGRVKTTPVLSVWSTATALAPLPEAALTAV